MPNYLDLFEKIRNHTDMFVLPETYARVSAFIHGFDLAHEGGVLEGFREWLVARSNGPNSEARFTFMIRLAFPDEGDPSRLVISSATTGRKVIKKLFDLINEFITEKQNAGGLKRIFLDYQEWLCKQSWYDQVIS